MCDRTCFEKEYKIYLKCVLVSWTVWCNFCDIDEWCYTSAHIKKALGDLKARNVKENMSFQIFIEKYPSKYHWYFGSTFSWNVLMHKSGRKSERMVAQQMVNKSYLWDVLLKWKAGSLSGLILHMSVLFGFVTASICYFCDLCSWKINIELIN